LFDDYYKTIFRPYYDPLSMLALQKWLKIINKNWENLGLNETLEALRSYARYHMLYIVSMIIANANGQEDKVPFPSKTLQIPEDVKNQILQNAVNYFNMAFEQAYDQAVSSNKVFSPQNWLKKKESIQLENFATKTVVTMLKSSSIKTEFLNALKLQSENFDLRWTAEGL